MPPKGRRRPLTLACYLEALVGSRIVVELHSDTIVRGRLFAVGECLGLQLEDTTLTPLQGPPRKGEYLYLRGSSIRFVHTPANVTPSQAIATAAKKRREALTAHAAAQGRHAPSMPKGTF